MDWIMKQLIFHTYDPLSITQMDSAHSLSLLLITGCLTRSLLYLSVTIIVFHLVSSPLICITPLMVAGALVLLSCLFE